MSTSSMSLSAIREASLAKKTRAEEEAARGAACKSDQREAAKKAVAAMAVEEESQRVESAKTIAHDIANKILEEGSVCTPNCDTSLLMVSRLSY